MALANEQIQNDYSVEVNLCGRLLDPDKVTSIIGLKPIEAARTGDPRHNGHSEGSYEEGFWAHESFSHGDLSECRDHQLVCLVGSIEPHIDALRAAGVERIYFYYTLSSFNGLMNIRFRADTLEKLGRLGADLYVSCFDFFNPKHPFWQAEPTLEGTEAAEAE